MDMAVPPLPLSDALLFADPDEYVLLSLSDKSDWWFQAIVLATPFFDNGKLECRVYGLESIDALTAASIRFDPSRGITFDEDFRVPKRASATARTFLSSVRRAIIPRHAHAYDKLLQMMPNLTSLSIRGTADRRYKDFTLPKMVSLQELEVEITGIDDWDTPDTVDMTTLALSSSLKKVVLKGVGSIRDLSALESNTSIETLHISSCDRFEDMSGVKSLTRLRSLTIDCVECELMGDFFCDYLAPLACLRELRIGDCQFHTWNTAAFAPLASLVSLSIQQSHLVRVMPAFGNFHKLEELRLLVVEVVQEEDDEEEEEDGALDVSGLAQLKSLQVLQLADCEVKNSSALSELKTIHTLDISASSPLEYEMFLPSLTALRTLVLHRSHFSSLPAMASLLTLNVTKCKQLVDVSELATLGSLRELDLSSCEQLADVSSFAKLTSLQILRMPNTKVSDLSPFRALPSLAEVDLSRSQQLTSLSGLQHLPSLTTLDLSECKALVDISALASNTALITLSLSKSWKVDTFSAMRSQGLEQFKKENDRWFREPHLSPRSSQ